MSTQLWIGNAAPATQVTTYTPGSVSASMVFTFTCNSKTVSYTTSVGTVADVCSGLATAIQSMNLNGTVAPEYNEFTAQALATAIVLTGNTPGLPFIVTGAASGGGSVTIANTTSATGPNDWANGANWSTGSAPVTGDAVYFNQGSVSCLYNLAPSSVTLASLNVLQAYTGQIGLPPVNAKSGYAEYRTQELTTAITLLNIGQGTGNGSGLLKFNVGSVQCTVNVYNSGQPLSNGSPAIFWRGTDASNVVSINKGNVGIAFYPNATAVVSALNLGYVANKLGDAVVTCGVGASITTITQNGGALQVNNGATTIASNIGTVTVWSGAVGTLDVNGGTCVYNSTGTLTTAEVSDNGFLDFGQDQRIKGVTNPITIYGDNATINDPFKVVSGLVVVLESVQTLANITIGETLSLTRA